MNKKFLSTMLFVFTILSIYIPSGYSGCGLIDKAGGSYVDVVCYNQFLKLLLDFFGWVWVLAFLISFIISFFLKNVTKGYFIAFGTVFIISVILRYSLYFYIIR